MAALTAARPRHRLATGLIEAMRRAVRSPRERFYLSHDQLVQIREEAAGRRPRMLTRDPSRRGEAVALPAASAPVRSQFTSKEALDGLNDLARNLRHRKPLTTMQAFAAACDQRPDLAEAAGMSGAGTGSLTTWMAGASRSHAEGRSCGGANGVCAGWQPAVRQ